MELRGFTKKGVTEFSITMLTGELFRFPHKNSRFQVNIIVYILSIVFILPVVFLDSDPAGSKLKCKYVEW